MVKDTLNSIFDNLKERTTNPFLGTLIIVWVFRNWTLVYGLFNFDQEFKLKDKLKYISDYYDHQSFICNMLFVVLITLAVLFFTYCMLAISRFLTDTYDKRVIPFIASKTDKSSVVLKTEYLKLQDIIRSLESRLEEERLAKVGAQSERDAIDQKLHTHLNRSITNLTDENNTYKRIEERFKSEGILLDEVREVIGDIQEARAKSKNSPIIHLLLSEGLIEVKEKNPISPIAVIYSLTDEGRQFLRYLNTYTRS